tara:strand:+ start:1760 stop:2173 length:414 start_codon:yes stop_codon:yes gene_type:complete
MNKDDIELIVSDVLLNFSKDIKKPVVLFLEKKRFSHFLDMMNLKKHLSKTPCFVAEMKGGDVIYYCEEIINELTKGMYKDKKKMFVEAVTIHELYHIWNKIEVGNQEDALFSEELVWEETKKEYPEHYKLLKKFSKR